MAILTAPAPSGGDDQAALQAFLNSAGPGDYLSFASGSTYRHSARLLWKAAATNVTVMAEGVTWLATNSTAATFYFNGATNVEIVGLWHKTATAPTTRNNNANDVALFAFNSTTGIKLNRIRSTGSAGAATYFWNATGGEIKNSIVENSLADGWHFTNGSGGFTVTDCQAINNGDDAFAHIGYNIDGVNGRPQNITLVRPVVRDCRARAISYSGAVDCTANDVDLDGSLAAAIYFATERGDFVTLDTARCVVNGGRVTRAGTSYAAIPNGTDGAAKDQGFVLWLASGTGATVVGCVVNDLSIGNTGPANYDTFRAIQYGGSFTSCAANRTQLYSGSPSTYIGGNIPAAISPATSTNRRTETIPASTASSGTLGSGTGAPAPSTPTTTSSRIDVEAIPGTLTVLRADDVAVANGAAVTTWNDRKNRWALAGVNNPTKVAAGALNGQAAVRFNGTTQYLRMASAPALAQPFTFGIVLAPTTIAGDRQLIWQGNGGEAAIYTAQWFAYSGGGYSLTSPAPSTGGKILTFEYNGAGSAIQVNGANGTPATGNPGTVGMTAGPLLLMDHGSVDRYFGGDLYEVRIWDHVLSDAEEAGWHSYCQERYGVAAADYVAQVITANVYGSGTGVLTATASRATTAQHTGAGTLSATLSGFSRAAVSTGAGTLTATASRAATVGATETGSGSTAATGAPATATSGPGTGTGVLSATSASAGGAVATGTAAGTTSATTRADLAVAAFETGTGTMTATLETTRAVSATFTGAGATSAAGSGWVRIFTDDYNRPAETSATPVGYRTAGSGLPPSWRTTGTQLVHNSTGNVTAFLLPETRFTQLDQFVSAVQGGGSNNAIVIRYVDPNNYYGLRRTSAASQMYRVVNGTVTLMGVSVPTAVGDTISLRATENVDGSTTITPAVNGVESQSATIQPGSSRHTGMEFGYRAQSSNASTHTFDDLVAEQFAPAPATLPAITTPAPFTGAGTSSTTSSPTATAGGTTTAAGAFTATSAPSLSAPFASTGAGSLSGASRPSTASSVAGTGAGTTAASTALTATSAPTLTGSGTLAASAVRGEEYVAAFTGAGASSTTATAALTISPGESGSGTTTATSTATTATAATLSGSGALAATSGTGGFVTAAPTGTGSLTAAARPAATVQATSTAAGSSSSTSSMSTTSTATSSGTGALAASGVLPTDAGFTGSGTLSAITRPAVSMTAVDVGAGSTDAAASLSTARPAAVTGSGTLTAVSLFGLTVLAATAATGTVTGTATTAAETFATAFSEALMAARTTVVFTRSASRTGAGYVYATTAARKFGVLSLSPTGWAPVLVLTDDGWAAAGLLPLR